MKICNVLSALVMIAVWGVMVPPVVGAPVHEVEVTTAATEFSPGTAGDLERLVASHSGRMGIYFEHLGTGEIIAINADQKFPTASTIKTAVMAAVFAEFESTPSLFQSYFDTRTYDATTSTGGSGFIRNFADGTKIELKELLHLMITVSDNIGTNMLVEWLGGLERVNEWLESNGFEVTRMASLVGGRAVAIPQIRETWGLGVTTPREMGRLLRMIVQGEAGTPAATDEMLRLLGNQYFDGGVAGGVPPTVYVGSKGGSLNRSRSDTGIVASRGGTYVVSVYTAENADTQWTNQNEASRAITAVSRILYRHANPDDSWEPPAGVERF